MDGLLRRGALKIVMGKDIPKHENILGGRFVLAIKNVGTDEEIYKARFVVQGHIDIENNMLVHASSSILQQTTRMIIAVDAIFGFQIWSKDVLQAYLQRRKPSYS